MIAAVKTARACARLNRDDTRAPGGHLATGALRTVAAASVKLASEIGVVHRRVCRNERRVWPTGQGADLFAHFLKNSF